jgi:hypothetical protein
MRMFSRRDRTDHDGAAPAPAPAVDDGRRWHHGPTRAIVTLLAAGVAGLLAWVTTKINDGSQGGYWAVYGILAGAGLVVAASQLIGGWTKRGRPMFSPAVFVIAFVPSAVVVLWIAAFHQPTSGLWHGHVMTWSRHFGIANVVRAMGGQLLSMLAFGLGVLFGFCFDTTGARRRPLPPAATMPRRAPTVEDEDADANRSITRERERDREKETVHS